MVSASFEACIGDGEGKEGGSKTRPRSFVLNFIPSGFDYQMLPSGEWNVSSVSISASKTKKGIVGTAAETTYRYGGDASRWSH